MQSAMAVQFERVTHRVGETAIVSDLDFAVEEGAVFVLLGRSGSGKTTALKLINGLLTPQEGLVRVYDKPTFEWDPIQLRRSIGYVIQEVGLFPHLSVERNVGLVPFLNGQAAGRIRDRVHQLLELVDLSPAEYALRYPDELSGGQRQRVGIARALAADPPLLIMDEPFGALDPLTRTQITREFSALQKELGKTVVLVTHDVREALFLGTKIGLMSAGRLVEVDTPEGFLSSDSREARAYVESLDVLPPAAASRGGGEA